MKKSSWQALSILSLILFVVFAAMTYHWCAKVTKLRKSGRTEQASVVKHEVKKGVGKHRRRAHFLAVTFFADKPGSEATPTLAPTEKPKNDSVSRILGGLSDKLAKMGNRKYISTEIPVDEEALAKYPVGSKVKIVYLVENPKDAMLADRLAEFDFTIYYAITGFCLLVFVGTLVMTLKNPA